MELFSGLPELPIYFFHVPRQQRMLQWPIFSLQQSSRADSCGLTPLLSLKPVTVQTAVVSVPADPAQGDHDP